MEVIKPGTKIDFVGLMPTAMAVSFILIIASVIGMVVWPKPNWGIDFAGGTEIQVSFKSAIDMGKLRSAVEDLNLGDTKVQEWIEIGAKAGTKYLIRVEKLVEEKGAVPAGEAGEAKEQENATTRTRQLVEKKLTDTFGANTFDILKTDYVGPKVGKELRNQGLLVVIIANLLIMVYVAVRFEFRFGVGAVLALFHDAIISIGFVVFTYKSFDLNIIAALLTIVGYSTNDTIVVFDRIRENIGRHRRLTFREMVNLAINETLSRTLLTSVVTAIAVFFLWIMGGGAINGFASTMLFGIVIGTYSSIFVASAYVILWEEFRARKRTTVETKG